MARSGARRKRIQQAKPKVLEKKLRDGGQIIPFGPTRDPNERMSLSQVTESLAEMEPSARGEMMDRLAHALFGQITTGFSPAALIVAYTNWWAHISMAPYRRAELAMSAIEHGWRLAFNSAEYLWLGNEEAFDTEDKRFEQRFRHESWRKWPYNLLAQAYLDAEEWWCDLSNVRGMNEHHKKLVRFARYQWLNALSPENNPLINPAVTEKAWNMRGLNFIKGFTHMVEDAYRRLTHQPDIGVEHFDIGKDVAASEGKVIYRNALFELIQYAPQTKEVYPEPLLIVPAWIMKYYILDLEPRHSMVKYLVEQGHTVFMISWKNPDARYRDIGFTDYLHHGLLEAYKQVLKVTPDHQPHMIGYCIGGTLLSMAAAYLSAKEEKPFKTITLFAALTDFEEPGQLMNFIDESQLTYIEDIMFSQGYLRGDQISSAFDLLKPRELIWSKLAQSYLFGERSEPFDLMAWSEDTTRLPYRMHSEYLRQLYLNNALSEGDFEIDGVVLDLDTIETPMFIVTTEHDHIAPWKSVYKINLLTDTEITYVLASGGHNGGIISEPGHEGRSYRIAKRPKDGRYIRPEKWRKQHEAKQGSWWPDWHKWLAGHSGRKGKPPPMGASGKGLKLLEDAPGKYVHEH
ncbi:MAG: PHA/PHB synthase family protein [Pseudomonadota bacterium]